MADYEPLRRQGAARKKKICICVGVTAVIAVAAAAVVVAMFFWNTDGFKGGFNFFNRNTTNSTSGTKQTEQDFASAFKGESINFNITMRLSFPKPTENKSRRSAVDDNCDDGSKLKSICKNTTDFKECDQDKLKEYLESFISTNFKAQLKENEDKDPFFMGVKSTELKIEFFDIKKAFADAKAVVTVTYEKALPSIDGNQTDAQIELEKLVNKIDESFKRCPKSSLVASKVTYGLQAFQEFELIKTVQPFLGTWDLVSSENFEEVLEAVGVGMFLRKIAISQKPKSIIKYDEDKNEWTFVVSTPFRTLTTTFEIGKEFKDELQNGKPGKSTITVEERKFIQTQKDLKDNIVTIQTRELTSENEYMLTLDAGKVVAKRGYKRA